MIGELDDSRIGKEIDDWMIGRLDDWGRDGGRRSGFGSRRSEISGQGRSNHRIGVDDWGLVPTSAIWRFL